MEFWNLLRKKVGGILFNSGEPVHVGQGRHAKCAQAGSPNQFLLAFSRG